MNEVETNQWRERVIVSLAEIQTQQRRAAADRESEKETVLRLERALRAEDRELIKKIDDHSAADLVSFNAMNTKLEKISSRVLMIVGGIIAAQGIATLALAAVALLK